MPEKKESMTKEDNIYAKALWSNIQMGKERIRFLEHMVNMMALFLSFICVFAVGIIGCFLFGIL